MYGITGKNNNANNLLATILKDNPKDTDALAMRAALQLTTGNRDQIKLGVNELQSLVSKTPNNHLLRFNLARGLVAIGEIERARLDLEAAVKRRPDLLTAGETLAR